MENSVSGSVMSTDKSPPPGDGNLLIDSSSQNSIEQNKCTVCPQAFSKFQECLRHELLEHCALNNHPQKTLRNKLNAVLKSLGDENKQTLHAELKRALSNCSAGQELHTILKYYRMNVDNLELIYARIHTCLQKELQPLGLFKIHPFGSAATGLALRDCDFDLYIEVSNHKQQSVQRVYNHTNCLLHLSHCFEEVIAIRQARVPIIKCKHSPTGFSLDINVSCPSSVLNSNFVRDLLLLEPRLHELTLFLKIWAKHLQLIGPNYMTSYCWITMIIFCLQQTKINDTALLPAVRDIQANQPDVMVLGINYAYNVSTLRVKPLPQELTVMDLVRGFFSFWLHFDFKHQIAAPYLGKAIPTEDFKSGAFKYDAYEDQLRDMKTLSGETKFSADPIQIDRCMSIQDPFCLNHNVAKSMSYSSFAYLSKCLQHAHNICMDPSVKERNLYEALLYGVVEAIARSVELKRSLTEINQPVALKWQFMPCHSELKALASYSHTVDSRTLNKLWIEQYVQVISEIITEVYCLDMQSATPTHSDKQQRLEVKQAERIHTWLLSGSVDLWTGRHHHRSKDLTFMEYQISQTNTFMRSRRQDANFAVQVNGCLTISIIGDNSGLELKLVTKSTTNIGLAKKDPLRKFFAMLKLSVQNFNLKEKLKTNTLTIQQTKIDTDQLKQGNIIWQ